MDGAARAAAVATNSVLGEFAVNRSRSQDRCGLQGCQGADVRETGADVRQQICLPLIKLRGMKFSDLLSLPYSDRTSRIDLDAIKAALPLVPESVATQLLSDHGRNEQFQDRYGHLILSTLHWEVEGHSASQLVSADVNPEFKQWFCTVAARADSFAQASWKCVDSRTEIREHWAAHGTWLTPPVMLDASLVGSVASLFLIEGHTRLGLLSGLVRRGIISGSSTHLAWVGRNAA